MPKKVDTALIAVLVNREHSRLSSQVKTLGKALHEPYSDKEQQRLPDQGRLPILKALQSQTCQPEQPR